MKKNKVLVIGWDAADWKAINPLIEQGFMPNLKKMIANGVSGKLATLNPPLSPMLWTSIATGKRPYKHGILGFTEPKEDGSGIQPVLNTNRKCKAIWNILTQLDKKTHVVGWWPSHPAEPINGISLSNFYQKAHMPKDEKGMENWPFMDKCIHPESKEDLFAKLRVHPLEFTAAHLLPFLPNGRDLDQTDETIKNLLNSVRKIMADCCTIHSAITYILENEAWDFVGVYYDAIDHFGHGFMKFHPPKRDHIPDHLYKGFYNVVNAGYRLHDMFLGKLLDLAGEDTDIILISDHGFHPDHLRLESIPHFPAAAAMEHSQYGIIVAQGPSFKVGKQIYGASLLDMTPTLLHLYNLPVGDDMDGKVLKDLFRVNREIKKIESWEKVDGACGMHPDHVRKDQQIDQDTMEQLIELGYIERPHPDAQIAIDRTVNEMNYWLATSMIDGHAYKEAIPILEKLFDEHTDQMRYGHLLVSAYQRLGKNEDANRVLNIMAASNQLDDPNTLLLEAKSLLAKNEVEAAIDKFNQVEQNYKGNPDIYLHLGQAHLQLGQYDWAIGYFKKALKIDFQNHHAFAGLGTTAFSMGNFEDAAENFIESLSLMYYQPSLHFYLGESLEKLGDTKGAARAFKAAIELTEKSENIQSNYSVNASAKTGNNNSNSSPSSKEILIVSGLPRSGTSMMMQMLEKGGIEIFSDDIRLADESNPKGYYEHEKIKNLAQDKSVLKEIQDGSVVKIIAQLLLFLPKMYNYRIIFMIRDINEIILSQDKMLDRLAQNDVKIKKNRSKDHLIESYQQTIQKITSWSKSMDNVNLLFINYSKMIENARESIPQINDFMGGGLNINDMAGVVDKSLYREKIK